MLLRKSPFLGEDEDEIYDAILSQDIVLPSHLLSETVDILQNLLAKLPEQRLGSGAGDENEVMNHPFFMGLDWKDVHDQKVQPPFIPRSKGPLDVNNFDAEFTSAGPVLTPVHSGELSGKLFGLAQQLIV